jgi:signal transduction histidine kinase
VDHLPVGLLADIKPIGAVAAEVALSDGAWLRFDTPLLTVAPFSLPKLGVPLATMLGSVLLVAAWVVHRSTQPISRFAAATERLGIDINAPPLDESGPLEVSTAAHTFNLMQERIRRLVEDRTAFAAAIAHDLGTPITRLHLRAHEIEEEGLRTMVLSDLEQMRRMITATLGFARSDFANEPPETFDLMSLVQSVGDDLADLGHDVSVGGPAHLHVHSKPLALRRVLSNLIENAVKYGARARVDFSESEQSVEIHIEDDGPGIPDDLHEEAFRPFRRLGTNMNVEGSGLGLSVARGIMRALGGDVRLANSKGGGLRATIVLPRRLIRVTERAQSRPIARQWQQL